jgi:ATP-binding cassette, subfamily F, member 3
VEAARVNSAEKQSVKSKEQKRLEAEQRQARSRERKDQQQLVHRLEKEISGLELKQTELTAELEKPETYQQAGRAMEINRELIHVQERLAELTPKWEAASVKLEEVEG